MADQIPPEVVEIFRDADWKLDEIRKFNEQSDVPLTLDNSSTLLALTNIRKGVDEGEGSGSPRLPEVQAIQDLIELRIFLNPVALLQYSALRFYDQKPFTHLSLKLSDWLDYIDDPTKAAPYENSEFEPVYTYIKKRLEEYYGTFNAAGPLSQVQYDRRLNLKVVLGEGINQRGNFLESNSTQDMFERLQQFIEAKLKDPTAEFFTQKNSVLLAFEKVEEYRFYLTLLKRQTELDLPGKEKNFRELVELEQCRLKLLRIWCDEQKQKLTG